MESQKYRPDQILITVKYDMSKETIENNVKSPNRPRSRLRSRSRSPIRRRSSSRSSRVRRGARGDRHRLRSRSPRSRSPERSKIKGNPSSSSNNPRLCSVEAGRDIKIIRHRRVNEKTEGSSKSNSKDTNSSRSRSRSLSRSRFRYGSRSRRRYSRFSSRSRSRSRSSPEVRKRRNSLEKNGSSCSSNTKRRRSRSRSLESSSKSKMEVEKRSAISSLKGSSKVGSSSGSVTVVSSTAGAETETVAGKIDVDDAGSTSEFAVSTRDFLEHYIGRLRSQIFFKDNKLRRLQRFPRAAHEKDSENEALLQTAWKQHDILYSKFQALEGALVSSNEEKLSLQKIVKKFEMQAELSAAQMNAKDCIIASLTGEVGQMQLLKQENEQLKSHYEKELGKKLELYQQQCADFVSNSIRTYQVSNRYLQLQLLSVMDNQLGQRHHQVGMKMNPVTNLKSSDVTVSVGHENRSDKESTGTDARVPSVPVQIPLAYRHDYRLLQQQQQQPPQLLPSNSNPIAVARVGKSQHQLQHQINGEKLVPVSVSVSVSPPEGRPAPAIKPHSVNPKKLNHPNRKSDQDFDREREKQKVLGR